ncbi:MULTISPECIES: substrate-binding domain-containing protein [Lachnospiraceae]|uniref:Substrate-binding domain-containing protein n=1 Tax=Faecalicatena acetigenes TaxID=2981790 RepID=A0ABT2TAD6_9FIRM|nr:MULTISPECIES: substrate-binding domain-containing protein [Lachnospiraceae]MCU6747240.1 substrate-binding domain-containing protein [Faecalicatena acetigenes]SCH75485.1 D-ribose-binding periplasmic protein precursor [uncultured Clostridium sp.]
MKKYSRKIMGIMLTVVMVLTLAVGCGSSQGTESKTEGTEKAESDKKVIGVSLLNCTHVFYNNIQKGLENKAEELGWELIIQDAAADANKQLSQVQDFITQDVDAIIICPTNSAGSKSMVELADEADIPVFTMDIESDGEVVSHVATDNYKGGQIAAEYMLEKILTDKKGDAAVITYSEIEACIQREKGFTDYLAENAPDVNVVDIQNYSGDQQKAADVMQNMLLKHENIDVVFAVGDPAAIGAQSSIDAAGKDTLIIGYDGNPEGIEAIKAGGNWVADVAQDPTAIAEKTLEAVKTKLEGGTPDKEIKIEPYIIDKENAE